MSLHHLNGKPVSLAELRRGPDLPVSLYRVRGFRVALRDDPGGIIAAVVEVPGVTAQAETRSEVLRMGLVGT